MKATEKRGECDPILCFGYKKCLSKGYKRDIPSDIEMNVFY